MKCWRVTLNDCDHVIVLAESPGKATSKAIAEARSWGAFDDWWELVWKKVRRRRLPELDGDILTERQLVEAGIMWTECTGCGERICEGPWVDEDVVWNQHDAPFCSHDCLAETPRWADREPTFQPTTAVLLSTEY